MEPVHPTSASRACPLHRAVRASRSVTTLQPVHGGRNVDRLSIDYAFQPRLRIRLTLGGITFPRKPWAFGDGDSHSVYRYSSWHIHLLPLHPPLSGRLRCGQRRSSTTAMRSTASARALIPDNYRRRIPRPVSCYALFKWWLLLSQHPGCHGNPTTLLTETRSGALAGGLGCFPFDHGDYPPQSYSHADSYGIRSLIGTDRLVALLSHSVALPPYDDA